MNYFDYQILKEDEYKIINEQYELSKSYKNNQSNDFNKSIVETNTNKELSINKDSRLIENNNKSHNINIILNELYSCFIRIPKNLNKNLELILNNCFIFTKKISSIYNIKFEDQKSNFNIFSIINNLLKIYQYLNQNNKFKNLSNLNISLISILLTELENSNIHFFKHM